MKLLTECPACGAVSAIADEVLCAAVSVRAVRLRCVLVRCAACRHGFLNPQPQPVELAPFYDEGYHVFKDTPMSSADIDRLLATRFDGVLLNHAAFVPGGEFPRRGLRPRRHGRRDAEAGIEHTPQPLSMLRECARILAPSGELTVAVPNIEALNARLFGQEWPHLSLPHHLQHFTKRTLERVAERAGLRCTHMATESLVSSVDAELCRWSRRHLLVPYRLSHRLGLFQPLARYLARRGQRADRGDAIAARFRVAQRSRKSTPSMADEPTACQST